MVLDPSHAALPGAAISVMGADTTVQTNTYSNHMGYYHVPFLRPGLYTITAGAKGFTETILTGIKLDAGQYARLDFVLKLPTPQQTVNVRETDPFVATESAALGTTVDRQFVVNLPLNGRTFQSLILLTPGVVQTNGDGQFSVNGQRDDANYLTVDGVSANVGISSFRSLEETAGGTVPGFNVLGGTHSLVAVDAMQEFRVQTSSYSAEFGRTPGGQVQIVTRSGTDYLHGSVFEYFRNDILDANDWFANALGVPQPPLRHNNFGGVLGGPILKARLFFFAAYEGLRLRLPQLAKVEVPSLAARIIAPAPIQQLLNALPRPNGPEDPVTMLAPFIASYSNPTGMDAGSIRIDHMMNQRLAWFGRFSYSPSNSRTRADSLTHVILDEVNTGALTLGATARLKATVINELRANYTMHQVTHFNLTDSLGGAVPPPDALMFPSPLASPHSSRFIFTTDDGVRFVAGRSSDHRQRQLNLLDNVSLLQGAHALKFGIDYRRLTPVFGPQDYGLQVRFTSVAQAASGVNPSSISVFTFDPSVFVFHNLSLYAQDTWRASKRLSLDYGLRWEFNPAPTSAGGQPFYTLTGFNDPATLRLAPAGTPLYQTTYENFAPRMGAIFQLSQRSGRELLLRGGFGIFYDLGSGVIGEAAESFPHSRRKLVRGVAFPDDQAAAPPLLPSLDPPYIGQSFSVFAAGSVLPLVYQWNVALEQSLGTGQSISVSYVGAAGRDLLRRVATTGPSPNFIDQSQIDVTDNSATSDYEALQIQYQRRLSRGLQALLNYAWSHSIDIGSTDTSGDISADKVDPQRNRGPSDFDIRHVFNAAFLYQVPVPRLGTLGTTMLCDWSVSGTLTARTSTPVDVIVLRSFGQDSVSARPDVVVGTPLYLTDASVPGGRRINPAAFSVPPEMRQGTLGRNALRGFSAIQLDFAVRRQFRLSERINLEGAADFFNAFNHPNFANPVGLLGNYVPPLVMNSSFGVPTATLGQAPFNGITHGLTSLYHVGGPRSVQLSLRLGF
jgi:hypothetical protein